MEFPTDRSYTETHEWIMLDGVCATIGISNFAQSELGEVVFVDLPEVGDLVEGGLSFADVESVKAVSEVISPVSGTIIEVNEELLDNPALINDAPYDAWFIKVSPATCVVETMDASAYKTLCNA